MSDGGWVREYARDFVHTMAPLLIAAAICLAVSAFVLMV